MTPFAAALRRWGFPVLVLGGLAVAWAAGSAGRVAPAEAHALVKAGAKLLDVRTAEEFAGGHVPGAVNVPVQELANRLAEVGPREAPVVVYCHSGSRSGRATRLLRDAGYTQVHDLGPMDAWGPL
jgi:phage shock protein E